MSWIKLASTSGGGGPPSLGPVMMTMSWSSIVPLQELDSGEERISAGPGRAVGGLVQRHCPAPCWGQRCVPQQHAAPLSV